MKAIAAEVHAAAGGTDEIKENVQYPNIAVLEEKDGEVTLLIENGDASKIGARIDKATPSDLKIKTVTEAPKPKVELVNPHLLILLPDEDENEDEDEPKDKD